MYDIPLSIIVLLSNINDSITLKETYEKMNINTNPQKYYKSNRHKQYLLADPMYDSKKNRTYLTEKGLIPIILYNKRNTKDKCKIKKLNSFQKRIYKRRIVVENSYAWFKQFCKIDKVYEKTIESYNGLVLLISYYVQ